MATTIRRRSLLGPLAAAVVASVPVAAGAHATVAQGDTVVNSAKGFIGCLSDEAWTQSNFPIYCLAMQVPSTGPDAGHLTTDAWTCRYSDSGAALSIGHRVLSASALKVRADGSFTFAAHLPGMGQVSVVGAGGAHGVEAEPITRVIGPTGYRPQGYTLASPTAGLTNYGLDPTTLLGPSGLTSGPSPTLISASINGHLQDELIGTVWRGLASGEWDFETC